MKRIYEKPLTEVTEAQMAELIMHSNDYADSKWNGELIDEEDDAWAVDYDLWGADSDKEE